MGKVEKFVKKREQEKHTTTKEFIATANWYIQEMAKLDKEFYRAKVNLAEAYNARLTELKAKEEVKA